MNSDGGHDERIRPQPSPERPIRSWTDYDESDDSLMVYFFGSPEAAISYRSSLDRRMYLRLSLDKHEIIGLQIDAFTRSFLADHPDFIHLARAVGVPEHLLPDVEPSVDTYIQHLKADIDERELTHTD